MFAFLKNFLPKMTAAFAAAFLLAGCFQENGLSVDSSGPAQQHIDDVSMQVRMRVGAVNALSKGQTISLSKMIVMITSVGATPADTIRDTITPGKQGFTSSSTSGQTIDSIYSLKGLRAWKVVVTVRDTKDSVVHKDSASTPVLRIGDAATVTLGLSSRYAMYDAKFVTIPDSISSVTGNLKQVLRINRLVLKVDGVIVKDSTSSPKPWFDSLTTHTLSYDYVNTLSGHTVEMSAYGPMGSWNVANPLFTGSRSVTPTAGLNDTVAVTLNWVGPTTGGGSITATLGRVGKVTITGKLPGTL